MWYYNPHTGGNKIPPLEHDRIRKEAIDFAQTRQWSNHTSLVLRFRGQFCYIDTLKSDEEHQMPLCRLRYVSGKLWSLALYTYSNERYEACILNDGKHTGTLAQAILVCEPFIF